MINAIISYAKFDRRFPLENTGVHKKKKKRSTCARLVVAEMAPLSYLRRSGRRIFFVFFCGNREKSVTKRYHGRTSRGRPRGRRVSIRNAFPNLKKLNILSVKTIFKSIFLYAQYHVMYAWDRRPCNTRVDLCRSARARVYVQRSDPRETLTIWLTKKKKTNLPTGICISNIINTVTINTSDLPLFLSTAHLIVRIAYVYI